MNHGMSVNVNAALYSRTEAVRTSGWDATFDTVDEARAYVFREAGWYGWAVGWTVRFESPTRVVAHTPEYYAPEHLSRLVFTIMGGDEG